MAKKYLITLNDECERKLNLIVEKFQKELKEQGIPGKVAPTSVVQSMVESVIIGFDNVKYEGYM